MKAEEAAKAKELGGTSRPTKLRSDGQRAGPQHEKGFAAETAAATGLSKRHINRLLAEPKLRLPPPAPRPQNDEETVEEQVGALMRAWNRAGPETCESGGRAGGETRLRQRELQEVHTCCASQVSAPDPHTHVSSRERGHQHETEAERYLTQRLPDSSSAVIARGEHRPPPPMNTDERTLELGAQM